MNLKQMPRDVEKMVDGLMGHVWPGGHRSPPILDEIERQAGAPDFAWVDGKAVPVGDS